MSAVMEKDKVVRGIAPLSKARPRGAQLRERMMQRGRQPVVGYDIVDRFSSGSLAVDRMLGGGIPRGLVVNFWGQPSTGKTTMAQLVVAACLKQGGEVAYIDTEGAYDPYWAYRLGITENVVDHLHLYQPGTGEDALDLVHDLLRDTWVDEDGQVRGAYDLIVLDSIGMLSFEPEREGDASNAHVGVMARKLSTFIRARGPELKRLGTTLLTINHVTMKVGQLFGNPETQPGGLKMRFANAIEVYFIPPHRIPKDINKDLTGYLFRMRAVKNKTSVPFRRASTFVRVDDYFGVDVASELAGCTEAIHGEDTPGLLKDLGLLFNKEGEPYRGGAMYILDNEGDPDDLEYRIPNGTKPANSKATLAEALRKDPALRAYLISQVHDAIKRENSVEGIMQALRAGTLRMAGDEAVPAEDAFDEVPTDEEVEFGEVVEEAPVEETF
jgi:protein RecA